MKYIGRIESRNDQDAVILVKKVLPCKDSCRSCSAGCKYYETHIYTEVADDIKDGDYVNIERKAETSNKSEIIRYIIPTAMIILAVVLVQLIPAARSNGLILALAILFSVISSHFVQKYYDKTSMKRNARNFVVGKKIE